MTSTCGIDWSERHHDVAIADADALVVARARITNDAAGFGQLIQLLAAHACEPTAFTLNEGACMQALATKRNDTTILL